MISPQSGADPRWSHRSEYRRKSRYPHSRYPLLSHALPIPPGGRELTNPRVEGEGFPPSPKGDTKARVGSVTGAGPFAGDLDPHFSRWRKLASSPPAAPRPDDNHTTLGVAGQEIPRGLPLSLPEDAHCPGERMPFEAPGASAREIAAYPRGFVQTPSWARPLPNSAEQGISGSLPTQEG